MKGGDREWVLYVPGLLGAAGLRRHFEAAAGAEDLGLLARFLSRAAFQAADQSRGAGVYEGLFRLCAVSPGTGLPLAAVSRFGEGGDAVDGYWLRADPVCLEADRDCVVMREHLAPSPDQCRAFLELLRGHLAQDGLALETGAAGRWYVRLTGEAPLPETTPLHEVLGRDIHDALPRGAGGGYWRRLLNEVQMLLHDCAVNEARRTAGELPVTSLWFWGGGVLPAPAGASPWTAIWAGDAVARGLARLCGAPLHELPDDGAAWLGRTGAPGRHLLVWDDLWYPVLRSAPEEWAARLVRWQRDWLAPLVAALAEDGRAVLSVYDGSGGVWRLRRRDWRRWWRRSRPLAGFLARDP